MLLPRVRQFVRQHALFHSDTRVMVAVSGGSDSVALATLLGELAATGDLRLVGVAHFNHQLREDADRDEQFSAAVARSHDLPFAADREDVRARARRERRSLEDAAREARHAFFERARLQHGADVVALGHTRDDQAETFLLRLVRGAGPRGLAAMYPRHGTIVRPVLDCGRQELRAYLDEQHIMYVDDETNRDVSIPRNRVRAELIPLLTERFNPAIVGVLAHEAELARETWAWLETEAATFEQSSETTSHGDVPLSRELDVERLAQAPPALRRLVLWRAMNSVANGRSVSFSHVEAALDLLGTDGRAVDAPGQRVQRLGARLVLTARPLNAVGRWPSLGSPGNHFEYSLSVPGQVELAEADCVVSAEVVADGALGSVGPSGINQDNVLSDRGRRHAGTPDGESSGSGTSGGKERTGRGFLALVRRDRCAGALTVRNRRPGDRFEPVGLGRQKKLQDYFVDRKVAQAARERVPLVVDEMGRIVWVAGYGIDEAFRVTDASQGVLLLKLKFLGGCP